MVEKELRLKIYKRTLEFYKEKFVEDYYFVGFCYCFLKVCEEFGIAFTGFEDFPELLEYKPKELLPSNFWWPWSDSEIRISVLNKIINKMQE